MKIDFNRWVRNPIDYHGNFGPEQPISIFASYRSLGHNAKGIFALGSRRFGRRYVGFVPNGANLWNMGAGIIHNPFSLLKYSQSPLNSFP
tara:strand:+ start:143 stop:412 length:270 start_codon:yes stop_codon:yes gene_type:complete